MLCIRITAAISFPLALFCSATLFAESYNFNDGKRVHRMELVQDLRAEFPKSQAQRGNTRIVRTPVGEKYTKTLGVESSPVFRSPSGQLMTLPGGVILVFREDMNVQDISRFWSHQNIDETQVRTLTFTTNAYKIETAPGVASLNLSNTLVVLPEVLSASPNWWQKRVSK